MSHSPSLPPHICNTAVACYPCGARGIVKCFRPAARAVDGVSHAPGAIVIRNIRGG